MHKIKDIRVTPLAYELGAAKAYGSSRGKTPRRVCGLVELETEDGVVGIGEAWGPGQITRAFISPAQDTVPHDGANERHDGAGRCVPDRDERRAVIRAVEHIGHGADRSGKQSNNCSREERLRRRAFPHEDEGQDHGWQRNKKNAADAEGNGSVGPPHDRKSGWIEYGATSQENDCWRYSV